jgi:hypothetical protein
LDAAKAIYNCLLNNWSISTGYFDINDYESTYFDTDDDVIITWREHEFDPKGPLYQIVVENYPVRKVWVVGNTYRVEHNVKISIYCKLKRYDLDTVNDTRLKWFDIKNEIDRILRENKYTVENIDVVQLRDGWNDRDTIAVGRGIKKAFLGKKHPIIWYSEQIVTCIYYEGV